MSIIVDLRDENWMSDTDLKKIISADLPNVDIYCGPATSKMPDITMAVVIKDLNQESINNLPNLKLIQKVGAGVEKAVLNKNLPDSVRIARMSSYFQAKEMAEYCLAEILCYQRNIRGYSKNQLGEVWAPIQPEKTKSKTVCVLGMGLIGGQIAKLLKKFGFKVEGWSRTQKNIPGIKTYTKMAGLKKAVANADYIIGILPETAETRGLLNSEIFGEFKRGSVFINIGRGTLIVEGDLLDALHQGLLIGATLDVTQNEPLPAGHPFWKHSKIAITPHVSGWDVDDALKTIALNYRKLLKNEPLLFEVDRSRGY